MTDGGPLKNKNDGVRDGIYRQATPNGVKGHPRAGGEAELLVLAGGARMLGSHPGDYLRENVLNFGIPFAGRIFVAGCRVWNHA